MSTDRDRGRPFLVEGGGEDTAAAGGLDAFGGGDGGGGGPRELRAARPRLAAFADAIARHDLAVLLCALVFALVAGAVASRLSLRTNFAELLPSQDPAVAELTRTTARIAGTQVLELAVESPDRAANLGFAAAVVERVRRLPPELVQIAMFDVREERRFVDEHKWLYADLPTLLSLRDALKSRIDRAKNPLLVDLLDEGESLEDLGRRLTSQAREFDRFPTGFFEGDGGKGPGSLVAIVIRPPGGLFGEHVGERLRDAVQAIVDELRPATWACALRPGEPCAAITVGLTGDVMAALDERAALESDLVWATGVCVLLVCLAMILFYGRVRAVPFVVVPALIGVGAAFAAADLLFGYLNSSTAFMGSIVVGNGINFAIIQHARYEEERLAGRSQPDAAFMALASTMCPTAVAALGAAAAYGSLTVTRFRGFSQFGTIGGIGMVAAWLATVVVLPAMWSRFDRRHGTGGPAVTRLALPGRWSPTALVARVVVRAPRLLLVVSLGLTVLSLAPLPRYLRDPFELDFTRLRNRRSLETGSAAIAPRVDRIFGQTLTPAAIVAERREQTEEIRRKILARDQAGLAGRAGRGGSQQPLIGDVRTLEDVLPGSAALQQSKLAALTELRALIDDPSLAVLDEPARAKLLELRPPESLRPIGDADLPRSMRLPFTENDGTLGRILLVYHRASVSVWDGRNLIRIADIIGEIPLDDGEVVRSSGHAVVFAAMIRAITHDAPLATGVSLLAVAALVLLLVPAGRQGPRGRRRGPLPRWLARRGLPREAALVVATLLIGVAWMLGAAAWLDVRTNFLNFIALPITFGIGVDYGINIFLRARLEGRGGVARAVSKAGGAVSLCSLTTIIGYGALLVADNQALCSFGKMAILGEVACLSAALLVLPAYLQWREARANGSLATKPSHVVTGAS